jgi:hypothetical protein
MTMWMIDGTGTVGAGMTARGSETSQRITRRSAQVRGYTGT